jgi:hypothetical protein
MGDTTVFWAIYLIITSRYKNKSVLNISISVYVPLKQVLANIYRHTKSLNATFFDDTEQHVMQAILIRP